MSYFLSRPFSQFKAVYETGSVNEAASSLGLTQPAITRGIAALQAQLGIRLFERTGHRLIATDAADILYRHSLSMDESLRHLDLELSGMQKKRNGVLRIGVGPIWSRYHIPEILARFQSEFPTIRLKVTTAIAVGLIAEFKSKRLDIFVGELTGVDLDRGTKRLPLYSTERSFWVSGDHPLNHHPNIKLQDLIDYAFIGHSHDKGLRDKIAKQFSREGLTIPEVAIEASSLELIMSVLAKTEMIAVLADVMAPEAALHELKQLSLPLKGLKLSAEAIYHAELEAFVPVQKFLNYLEQVR